MSYKVLNLLSPYLGDPIFPDIAELFYYLNDLYFSSKLKCKITWSNKMTRCAGLCYYIKSKNSNSCIIRLSEPLLKYRSLEDLIDTILHEMIHAYLFVYGDGSNSYHNRDGHGEAFQEWMHKINQSAGTRITVYHSFQNEVDLYRTHIWKCNGPCSSRPPYYGLVKRSINRPPQPADSWYNSHRKSCNGSFIKISPDNTHSIVNNSYNTSLKCPVCVDNTWFVCLDDLNDHLDKCLQKQSPDPIYIVLE